MEFHNLLESHELVCMGNVLEAGIAWKHATGERRLLDVAIRLADHLCAHFRADGGYGDPEPGHAGSGYGVPPADSRKQRQDLPDERPAGLLL